MKTVFLWMLTGAILGLVAASFIVPPMLSWYMTPGGMTSGGASVQAVVQVPEVIRYTTSRLLMGQSIGAGVGAVVGLALGIMLRRKRVPQPVVSNSP